VEVKVAVEVLVVDLEPQQLLDLRYKVVEVGKVLDHSPTGLAAAVVAADGMEAAAVVVEMTLDLEPVPRLVEAVDLDT
jgi:hypothetical protein